MKKNLLSSLILMLILTSNLFSKPLFSENLFESYARNHSISKTTTKTKYMVKADLETIEKIQDLCKYQGYIDIICIGTKDPYTCTAALVSGAFCVSADLYACYIYLSSDEINLNNVLKCAWAANSAIKFIKQ